MLKSLDFIHRSDCITTNKHNQSTAVQWTILEGNKLSCSSVGTVKIVKSPRPEYAKTTQVLTVSGMTELDKSTNYLIELHPPPQPVAALGRNINLADVLCREGLDLYLTLHLEYLLHFSAGAPIVRTTRAGNHRLLWTILQWTSDWKGDKRDPFMYVPSK